MWDSLVINSLMTILQIVIKNQQKRAVLRDKLRAVRDSINAAYFDDPLF